MSFVNVAPVDAIPPGKVFQAEIEEETYAVCNVGGELHALYGLCPHAAGPLGQGALHDNVLVCPWHGLEFDCLTGQNVYASEQRIPKYPVRIQDGSVWIDPENPL